LNTDLQSGNFAAPHAGPIEDRPQGAQFGINPETLYSYVPAMASKIG
jgi:hypothetical protein